MPWKKYATDCYELRLHWKVRECLTLLSAAMPNAVAAWVSRVDESAVRNTQDVNILLRRADFDRAKKALEAAGFVHGSDGC